MMQAGQIASVALLGIVGWSVSGHFSYVLVLLGLVFLAFFAAMYLASWRDIVFAAERLREIEADVKKRAGEELLKWETHWGGGSKPPIKHFFRGRPNRPYTS
jgi:hypothetical protein